MATLKHRVYDTDTHFIIDPVSRTMKNESTGKTRLIQGDHNSERFTFQIPRTIEGHDMTMCDKVEVHFTNTDVVTKQESRDFTPVEDLQVSPDGDDVAIFSWLAKKTATKYEGTLDLSVRFACTDDSTGEEIYVWGTFPFANISVAKGQCNKAAIVESTIDVLEQWRKELFELKPQLFLRYSAYSDGRDFSATWRSGLDYVGLSVGTTAPTNPTAYTWLLFKGENGLTPHIDTDSGHWFIGTHDTGVSAKGVDGDDGADGLTPYIGNNGNWWLGDEDTGVSAGGTTSSPSTHTHTYGDWEKYSQSQHKKVCACGSVAYAYHTWNDGVITVQPTETKEGNKRYTCMACGETKDEVLDKLNPGGSGGTTEPDEPTPSAYTLYCGSMRTTDAINANTIKSKCAGAYGTSKSAQFEGGCDRFLIAFQANYDRLQVIDTTPTFGGDATSDCEYYGSLLIDGISYKVYVWDTARVLTSGYPLSIQIS